MSMFASSEASAGRYIAGNVHRIGVRSAAMGGNHMALSGEISGAFTNPATILLGEDATVFSAEGFLPEGPEFDTENGQNLIRTRQDSPPLLLGISVTYAKDFAFALVDGLRYDSRFTGKLLVLDSPDAHITDYQEEVRLNSSGLVVAARALREWQFGLALYYDRQKVFKKVDYTVESEFVPIYPDYEAFGTATALHGAIGALWTPGERTSFGMALHTNIDLKNNLRVDTFRVDIVPGPGDPNAFFEESYPVSDDRFPWSLTLGTHHAFSEWSEGLAPSDLYFDLGYVNWGGDPQRKDLMTASLGAEWRTSPRVAFRGGAYTQFDASDYVATDSLSEKDARFVDIRMATSSTYPAENDEVFLTAGAGFKAGSFEIDASVEDSHLFADFGRTLVKLGLTAVLPSKSSKPTN
jgi:hypothetical protein